MPLLVQINTHHEDRSSSYIMSGYFHSLHLFMDFFIAHSMYHSSSTGQFELEVSQSCPPFESVKYSVRVLCCLSQLSKFLACLFINVNSSRALVPPLDLLPSSHHLRQQSWILHNHYLNDSPLLNFYNSIFPAASTNKALLITPWGRRVDTGAIVCLNWHTLGHIFVLSFDKRFACRGW